MYKLQCTPLLFRESNLVFVLTLSSYINCFNTKCCLLKCLGEHSSTTTAVVHVLLNL